MDFFTFALGYVALTAFLLLIMLFGESPAFIGTPVAWCHYAITTWPCDAAQWLVAKCFGRRGERAFEDVADCCCESSNPALQIMYLLIMGGSYYLYLTHLFVLLPSPLAGRYHIFTGTACMVLCLVLFVLASTSDPGTITKRNVAFHLKRYPHDGILFREKECWTCHFQRPARSKHCSVCKRCVARFDHHCAWINNCVGLGNQRLFLAFLAANLLVSVYAAALAYKIVMGEMLASNMLWRPLLDASGEVIYMAKSPGVLGQWIVRLYPIPVCLALFSVVGAVLMAGFLGYHLHLVASGITSYEMYKRTDLIRQTVMEERAYAKGEEETWGACLWRWTRRVLWGGQRMPLGEIPANVYDRGAWHNLMEVLLPGRPIVKGKCE